MSLYHSDGKGGAKYDDSKKGGKMSQLSIYVSYAWKAEEERRVVDSLEKVFNANGIHLNRDRNLGYKGSIEDYMTRLSKGDCVIVVLSKPYLESPNCMKELLMIEDYGRFKDRVFPLTRPDAGIYSSEQRKLYIQFWSEKYEGLNAVRNPTDDINCPSLDEDRALYSKIVRRFDTLTKTLADMKNYPEDFHIDSDFIIVFDKIRTQFPDLTKDESDEAASVTFRQKVHSILN
ncbi:MAG: toll/interleukin-1 receptor domain-containing protein, partial [Methylococcales bacterium]